MYNPFVLDALQREQEGIFRLAEKPDVIVLLADVEHYYFVI